jgi:citrate lyase subunit beta/citryl-CoA lyase
MTTGTGMTLRDRVPPRSFLFVPGDRPGRLAKALDREADALILDLEDSVAPADKDKARANVAAFLRDCGRMRDRAQLIVRVNGLTTGLIDRDLAAVIPGTPDAVFLPKAEGGASVIHLDAKLAVQEALAALADGAVGIHALATETASAVLATSSYAGCSPRLAGLAWGGEDLSAALGARNMRDDSGGLTDTFRLARSLCLIGAAAANVQAIDAVETDFRDLQRLRQACLAAWRDGFTGKLAIHPAQVPVINECFQPSAEELARARALVSAFEQAEGKGAIAIDGVMQDVPHLEKARRLLARHAALPAAHGKRDVRSS